MPTEKPRMIIHLAPGEAEYFRGWAKEERRNITGLVRAILTQAIAAREAQGKSGSSAFALLAVTDETKSERIVTYLEPEQRDYLEAWAKAESRTLPELARLLLEDAIARRRQEGRV